MLTRLVQPEDDTIISNPNKRHGPVKYSKNRAACMAQILFLDHTNLWNKNLPLRLFSIVLDCEPPYVTSATLFSLRKNSVFGKLMARIQCIH